MARPEDVKYTPTHEWARVEGDVATFGITDHAVEALGDLAFVDLPEPGASVKKGERFGEIESTKAVADLVSPLSGEVVEVNREAAENLALVSSSPFEDGWLVRVRLADPGEAASLLSAAEYEDRLAAEER
ncbi:MAG: glycine cleavage system protein GcvH [Planctomycetota bacterium]